MARTIGVRHGAPVIKTAPDFPGRLRELKARGGRMVVFDPRRTETAKVADEHHFVRPGTDAWVLLAMLHVLTTESTPTVASYVDGLGTVVDLVAELADRFSLEAAVHEGAVTFAVAEGAAFVPQLFGGLDADQGRRWLRKAFKLGDSKEVQLLALADDASNSTTLYAGSDQLGVFSQPGVFWGATQSDGSREISQSVKLILESMRERV